MDFNRIKLKNIHSQQFLNLLSKVSLKNLSKLRAVMTVAYLLKIPHKINEVRILKKQNISEQYKKINPDQKVPCIIDNENFFLNESHSIMRYFCQLYGDYKLYPADNLKRELKLIAIQTGITQTLFKPQLRINTSVSIEELESHVQNTLTNIENNYLSQKDKFFFGFDSYTLADISAYCEPYQSKVVDYSFQPYPNIQTQMSKMQQINEIQQTHKIYDELLNKRIQKQQSKL
ncbi:hypothetical protein ABPG72_011409 [Tetrahymena utriculariae]